MKYLKKGDIVWVDLTKGSEGSEQKGIRPCIIVQNDIGNKFSNTTIVVPMTTRKPKRLLPTHFIIPKEMLGGKGFKDSVVLCEQLKAIDKTRIKRKVTEIDAATREEINKKVIKSMFLDEPLIQ